MIKVEKKLMSVLEGYADFLWKMELARPKYQLYLVLGVREFLPFAKDHPGYTFEHTLNLFLTALRE